MFRNRISRITVNSHPQFFIRRSEIAFDERVRYVEFVCGIWNEGRFGPGTESPFVIDLSDQAEFESTPFSDLLDDEANGPSGLAPCDVISPLGRAGYQVVEAAHRKAKQMELLDAGLKAHNSTAALAPNQGRGSP